MTADGPVEVVVVGVGAVIGNQAGEVLLVRRANPPRQHEWSLPGGRLEPGECLRDAVVREIREETGLDVEIQRLLDVAELNAGATHYVLIDFAARPISGELRTGSDALEARWFTREELRALPLWSETRRMIELSAEQLSGT